MEYLDTLVCPKVIFKSITLCMVARIASSVACNEFEATFLITLRASRRIVIHLGVTVLRC